MIRDGIYLTEAERMRYMRELEEQGNAEMDIAMVSHSLAPVTCSTAAGCGEQLAQDTERAVNA